MFGKEVEIELISEDCVIPIEIHASFYNALVKVFLHYCSTEPDRDLVSMFTELKSRDPKEGFEFNVSIFLTLIGTIEESAKKNNMVTLKKVKLPSEEDDPES
jgi:hypothetical protein